MICKHTLRLATILSAAYKDTDTAEAAEARSAMPDYFSEKFEGISRGGNCFFSSNVAELLTQLLRDKWGASQASTSAIVMQVETLITGAQ